MDVISETDPDSNSNSNHQQDPGGNGTSSCRNIELPNASRIATAEAEIGSDEKEETDHVLLEKDTEIGNGIGIIQYQVSIFEEKLSAALLKLTAKDEMVKQHEKVAIEAVAGWEKAQSEVAVLKQQLEAASDKKLELEQQADHLDEALKECVKQLTQAKEEQDQKFQEAVLRKTREWDSIRSDLESQLLQLQAAVESSKAESDRWYKLQFLEDENLALKQELVSQSEQLELRITERDLNAQAAETASKQHLDSIRKLAKLEAENRNLRAIIRKSSSFADHKSVSVSSLCAESLTDSQSDCGEQTNAVEMNILKMGINECEPSCSDSWTSASFAELDKCKKQKAVNRNLSNSATEKDLMDDFLEMEHLAALPATEPPPVSDKTVFEQSSPIAKRDDFYQQIYELQEKLEKLEVEKTHLDDLLEKMRDENSVLEDKVRNMETLNEASEEHRRKVELRNNELADKLSRIEEEKVELDATLVDRMHCIEILTKQLKDNENMFEALRIELNKAIDSKQYYEQKATGTEVELKTMAAKVDALQEEVAAECARSKKLEAECGNLEDALLRQKHEVELELTARLNTKLKIKQEDLAVTALKLAECQQTIMSLGNQLQSLATLEDFLGDGKHSQLTVGGSLIPGPGGDVWKMHSNSAFLTKREARPNIPAQENDHAVGCASPKLITKDQIDNVNGENGHADFLLNCVEEVSNTARWL